MNYFVLHLLTFGVQLLLTRTEKTKTIKVMLSIHVYGEIGNIKIIARANKLKHKIFVVLDYYMFQNVFMFSDLQELGI